MSISSVKPHNFIGLIAHVSSKTMLEIQVCDGTVLFGIFTDKLSPKSHDTKATSYNPYGW